MSEPGFVAHIHIGRISDPEQVIDSQTFPSPQDAWDWLASQHQGAAAASTRTERKELRTVPERFTPPTTTIAHTHKDGRVVSYSVSPPPRIPRQ